MPIWNREGFSCLRSIRMRGLSRGLAVVRLGDRFGLIDRDGVWRIDCGRYDYVGPLSGGRALVRRDGLYGLHRPPRPRGDSREVSVRL